MKAFFFYGKIACRTALFATLCGPFQAQAQAQAQAQVRAEADGASRFVLPTPEGRLEGTVEHEQYVLRGVPYARPPEGALRWRPPVAPAAWSGIKDATHYGAACPQTPLPGLGGPEPSYPQSENCLTLNVWAPQHAQHLPVMVWIHGGGFVEGTARSALYDGAALARHGVVVVSFNYRVGRLGFFAHPALRAGGAPAQGANFGLMDQVAALHWVQDHIALLGGDPGNVTIFGQSAGGASVNLLLLSPLAQGLFHKAISQSGFPRWHMRALSTGPFSAEAIGQEFARTQGIGGVDMAAARALRALPAREVMRYPAPEHMLDSSPEPIIDGVSLTASPPQLLHEGAFRPVPLLVGGTSCDASVYGKENIMPMFSFSSLENGEFRQLYRADTRGQMDAVMQAETDFIETEPAQFQALSFAARGAPVWLYYFAVPTSGTYCQGAVHAAELPYVFGNTGYSLFGAKPVASARGDALSRLMMAYWTNFAKTGTPDAQGLPEWSRFDATTRDTFVFSDTALKTERDFRSAQMDWIHRIRIGDSIWEN